MMKNLRVFAGVFTLIVFLMGSAFSTAAQNCNPPTGIQTGVVTANSAQILYVPAPGSLYCQLQYRVAGSNAWSPLSAQTPTPILTIYNLMDSTTYEVQLRSICGNNLLSPWSPAFTFTTLSANGSCPPPLGVVVSAVTATSATLSWTVVAGVSNYYVYFKPANSANWNTYQVTSLPGITLNNLSPNTPYEYKIRSFCQGFGLGAYSPSGIFTTAGTSTACPSPSGLTAGNITSQSANINWLAVQGVGIGYQVQYRVVGSLAWSNMSATLPGINLSGLISNTSYELQVRTICGQNALSNWSALLTFTTLTGSNVGCPPPVGIVVSAVGNNWATISWTPVPGVILYQLSYKKATASNWLTVSTNTTSKTLFNLSDTTLYEFRVRCSCPGNTNGTFSPTFTFTTTGIPNPCTPPTGIQTINITSTSAKITWTPVPGAMSYQIRYRISGSLVWKLMTTQQPMIILNQLFDTTQYEYQLSSICSSNTPGVWSPSMSFTTLSASNACPPVLGITVGPVTNNTAKINWTGSAQGSYFQVYYQKAGTGNWMLKTTTQPGVMLTYLSDSTKYYFRIRRACGPSGNAGNLSNMSSLSPVDSFITLSAQSSPCLPPAGLNYTNLTAHSVKVLWNPVPGAYHYRLRYRPAGAQNWMQQTTQLPERMLFNLMDSMTFEVQVATFCGSNAISAWSPSLTFFTPDDPNTISPRMVKPEGDDATNLVSEDEFLLFPNPASESFSLSTESEGYHQMMLFNVQGQLLRSFDLQASGMYSLEGLASGLYIVRLANGEQMSGARKLIVK
jgi:hypothetical protein